MPWRQAQRQPVKCPGLALPVGSAAVRALPDPVTQALLHHTGPLAPFRELTVACETGDHATFARAATQLRLNNNQVNWAHVQALIWQERVGV